MAICKNFKLLAKDPKVIEFYEKCKAMGHDFIKPLMAYSTLNQYRKKKGYPEEWYPSTGSEFKDIIGYAKAIREAGASKSEAVAKAQKAYFAGEKQMYDALYGDFTPTEIREILNSLIHALDSALEEWAADRRLWGIPGQSRGALLENFGIEQGGSGFTLLVDALFRSLEPCMTEEYWEDSRWSKAKIAEYIATYKKVFENRKHITKLLAQKWGAREGFYIKINDSGEAEVSETPSEDSLEENTVIDPDVDAETDASDSEGDGETEFSNGDTFNDFRLSKMMEGLSPRAKRIMSSIPTGRLSPLGMQVYAQPNVVMSYLRKIAELTDNSEQFMTVLRYIVKGIPADEKYFNFGETEDMKFAEQLVQQGFDNTVVQGTYAYLMAHRDDIAIIYTAVAGQHVEYVNAVVRSDTGMQAASENNSSPLSEKEKHIVFENFMNRRVFVSDTKKYSIFDEHGDIRSDLLTEWIPRLGEIKRALHRNGAQMLIDYFTKAKSVGRFTRGDTQVEIKKIITNDEIDITQVDRETEEKLVYRFGLGRKAAVEDFLRDKEVAEALKEYTHVLQGMGVPTSVEAVYAAIRRDPSTALRKMMHSMQEYHYVFYIHEDMENPKGLHYLHLTPQDKKDLAPTAKIRSNERDMAAILQQCVEDMHLLDTYEFLDQRVQAKGKNGASSSYSTHTPQSLAAQMCKESWWKRLREKASKIEGYNLKGKPVGWFKKTYAPSLLTELSYNDVQYGELSTAQERTARFVFYCKRAAFALQQQADYSTGGQFIYGVPILKLYSTGESRYSQAVIECAEEVLCEIQRIEAIRKGLADGTRKSLGLYDERGQKFHLFPAFNENAFLERYKAITDQDEAQEFLYKTVEAELNKVVNDGIRMFDQYKICDNTNLKVSKTAYVLGLTTASTTGSISFFHTGGAASIMKEVKPFGECAFRIRTLKANMEAEFEAEKERRTAEAEALEKSGDNRAWDEALRANKAWITAEEKAVQARILEAQQEVIKEMLPDSNLTVDELNESTQVAKYELLAGYFVNEFYAQHQMGRWLSGGPSFYANEDDYNKRNGRLHAPHSTYDKYATNDGERVGRETQNVVYLNDNAVESYYLDTIKNIAHNMRKKNIITAAAEQSMIDAYSKIKTTDGVGVRTLESYRNVCIGTGTWGFQQEEAYKTLTNPDKYSEEYIYGALGHIMKEIKPVMTGWEEVSVGEEIVRVPVFHKYAEMVLLPTSVMERLHTGVSTPMYALSKAQEELLKSKKRVDMFLFNSGCKVGGFDSLAPFALDKANKTYKLGGAEGMSQYLVKNLSGGQNMHTFDMDGWGIAASTTVHENDEIALSLQAEYCVWANISDDDKTVYNGENVSVSKLRDDYFKIKSLLLARGFKDGRKRVWNVNKLYDMLMKEVASKEYNSTEMQFYLQQLKEGDTSILSYPQIARVVLPNITALLRKSILKQRHSGSNIFETTVFGLDMDSYAFDNDFAKQSDKLEVRFATDNNGNGYLDAIECALPSSAIPKVLWKYLDNDGGISAETLQRLIAEGKIDEDALRFMCYRTPADAEHSAFPCIIKYFMAPFCGNSIRMPKEAMVMDGHDYDGDKKRCHFKELSVVAGKIIADAGEADAALDRLNEDQLYNRSINLMLAKMRSECGNKQLIPGGAGELSRIARILHIFQATRSKAAQEAIALPLAKMRLQKKENEDVDAATLANVSSHIEMHSVAFFNMLKELSDNQLKDLVAALTARESIYLPSHTAAAFENIMVGHNMIGIEATHGNAAKLLQRVNLEWISADHYPISLFGVDFDNTRPFDPNNRNNGMITSTIGYLLNAAVDNTKDPILGMLGVTKDNAQLILLLLGMGCPPMEVFAMMKHPIMRMCADGIGQRKYFNLREAVAKVYESIAKEHIAGEKKPKYTKTNAIQYCGSSAFGDDLLKELSFNEKDIAGDPELRAHSMYLLKTVYELLSPAETLMTAIKLSRPFSKSGELAVNLEGILAQQFNREAFLDQLSKSEFTYGPYISGLEALVKPMDTQGCYDTDWVEEACEDCSTPEINIANDLMYRDSIGVLERHAPQFRPDWREMCKKISAMYGYRTHQTGTIRRVLNDMLLYLIMCDTDYWGSTPDEQRQKKLHILHEVPQKMIALKKRILTDDKLASLRKNRLLEMLELFTPSGDAFMGSGLSLMSLGDSNDKVVDSEEIRSAWGDLLRSNDPEIKEFGYELYLYELMRAGMDPTYNGYIQFAPMNVFFNKQKENFATPSPIAELIDRAYSDHDWNDEEFNQRFLTYYCLNHWQDKGFLTSVGKSQLERAGGVYTTPKKDSLETAAYWTLPYNGELALSLFRLPVVIVSRTEDTAYGTKKTREELFMPLQSQDGKYIYLKPVKKLGVAFRKQRKQVIKQYDPLVDPLDAEPLVSAHTIEEHGANSESKSKSITIMDGKRKRNITVPAGISKEEVEARINEKRALGQTTDNIARGIWTEQEEKEFAESGVAKVVVSVKPISRTAAMMNQNTLYLFPDNAHREGGTQPISDKSEYAKKYGTGLKFPAKGASRLRGLNNALPISTKKTKMDSSNDESGRWTDAEFDQFRAVIDDEFATIKAALDSGKYRKVSVEGFGGKAFLGNETSGITEARTPKLHAYLKAKLEELNLIVAEPEAAEETETEAPQGTGLKKVDSSFYTAKNMPSMQDLMKMWFGGGAKQGQAVVQHNMSTTIKESDGSVTTITVTKTNADGQPVVTQEQPQAQQQPQTQPKPQPQAQTNPQQASTSTNLPKEFVAWAKEKFNLDPSTMPPAVLGGVYGMWQQESGKKMYQLYRKNEDGGYDVVDAPVTPDNTREARRQAVQILLNQLLRKILESKNISVGVLLEFEQRLADGLEGQSYEGIAGVTDFDMFDTAKLTAEGMYELIRVAQGELGEAALPEEFAHLALAMLGDNKLATRLIDLLMQNDELMKATFGEEYESYSATYGHDRQKLAVEAAGKLVAEHLFKQADVMYRNKEERGIINKFRGLIGRVAAAIKRFFASLNPHSVRNAIYEAEDTASMIAEGLLAGDLVDQMELGNIDMTGKLFKQNANKVQQDLTHKNDILSRLLRVETKRLSLLKAQNTHTFKSKFNERLQTATERAIANLEKGIQMHKTETAVISYMEAGLEMLKQTSENLDLAVRKAETNAQACRAINATRQTIYSFVSVLDSIQQALRDKELEDTTGLRTTFNTLTAMLNELQTRYYQYGDLYFREALTGVYGPDGRRITVGKNKGKVRTIEEMATMAERDESLASRWFHSLGDAQDDVLTAVDDIIRNAKLTARRYVNAIRPRIETAFADLVRETGSKDQTFMFEYTTDKNGVKHKTGKYISNKSTEYANLTPAQKKFYDTMMEIKEEADKRLPDSLVSKYKMVMLRKYTWERVKNSPDIKSGAKALWEGIQQSVLDMSDNIDYENVEVIEDFEGNRVDMLPIKYIAKGENESYDDMVDDVATSMMAYVGMAYQYNELYGVAATIENMKYMSSERAVKQREFGGKSMQQTVETEDYRFTKPLTKKQMHTNIQKMMDDAIRMHLYGHTTRSEGTLGKTRVDKRKVSNLLSRLTSLAQMAFNPMQRVANVTVGGVNIAMEGVGSGLFRTKDAVWASGVYAKESADRLAQTGKTDYDNKLSLFNDKFDIHQDNMRKTPKYGKSRFSRTFNSGLMYAGLTMGEDYLACVTALAVARNIKCKGPNGQKGSLWDAYEVKYIDSANKTGAYLAVKQGWTKADGTAITEADEASFSKKVAGLNFQLQGIYNLDDKSAIQQWSLGSLLIMYRKWIAPSLKRRYGAVRYNALTEREEEGYYRTLFRYLSDTLKGAKTGKNSEEATEEETKEMAQNVFAVFSALRNSIAVNWKNMSDYERSNCMRSLAEIGVVLFLFIACAALTHIPPAEDDEKQPTRIQYLLFYQLLRLRNELAAQAPTPMLLNEAMKIIRSPFAAAEPMINILNAWKILWPVNWVTEVRSGRYKGHTKAYKYFRELPFVSMWKRAENLADPTPLIRYYQNDQIL